MVAKYELNCLIEVLLNMSFVYILEYQQPFNNPIPVTYNITPAPIATELHFQPYHSTVQYRPRSKVEDKFLEWSDTKLTACEGAFVAYDHNFVDLHDVVLDRKFATGRGGGEDIMAVINQPEETEYYTYTPGIFQLPCQERSVYYFNGENSPLTEWLLNLKTKKVTATDAVQEYNDKFVIAVTRFEYVNLYHTMTDFYNAFIMMEYFNQTQSSTEVLFMDGHPKGGLDLTWQVLFSSAVRVGSLHRRTRFRSLVWSTLGYESLLQDHNAEETPPLMKEFRQFFLKSFKVKDTRRLDCKRPRLTLVWRHDYVAHPRNPSGHITRKIHNERELIRELKKSYPLAHIQGVQIDLHNMQQQLRMISDTDMLIGMHGAGLTHALFLPSHGAVLEFLPNYWSATNIHFEAFSRWSGLHYLRWVNDDPENELEEHFTRIPAAAVTAMVRELLADMCPPPSQPKASPEPMPPSSTPPVTSSSKPKVNIQDKLTVDKYVNKTMQKARGIKLNKRSKA